MQGSAKDAPRTDSAKGFDSLAESGGSRVVEQTQRFSNWLAEVGEKAGLYIAPVDYGGLSAISRREEAYMSTLARKIPGAEPHCPNVCHARLTPCANVAP